MKFKLGEKKLLFDGHFMKLWGREFFDKAGKPQLWEYAEKADVTAVLPITEDGKAILIRNYRVPLQKYVIEVPAGLLDHEGEDPKVGAIRELHEETGYEASVYHALPAIPYRSGSSSNLIYFFIATGLKKVAENVGDDTEDLSIMEVPLNKLVDLWMNTPADTLFQPEIIAMYEAAVELGFVKRG